MKNRNQKYYKSFINKIEFKIMIFKIILKYKDKNYIRIIIFLNCMNATKM